jgi:hypothetical protein
MGLVMMSERDLKRIEVLTEVTSGRRTVVSAAMVLALGVRQTFRLLARYQEHGGAALVHKARGRTSNRQINAGIREYAVELVRSNYANFGPTLRRSRNCLHKLLLLALLNWARRILS